MLIAGLGANCRFGDRQPQRGTALSPCEVGNVLGCSQAAALPQACLKRAPVLGNDTKKSSGCDSLWSVREGRAAPAQLLQQLLSHHTSAASFSACTRLLQWQRADDEKSKRGERSPPTLSQHIQEPADISSPHVQGFAVLISEQSSGQQAQPGPGLATAFIMLGNDLWRIQLPNTSAGHSFSICAAKSQLQGSAVPACSARTGPGLALHTACDPSCAVLSN